MSLGIKGISQSTGEGEPGQGAVPYLPCQPPGDETAVLTPSKPQRAELSQAHGPCSPLLAPSLQPQREQEDSSYGASLLPAISPQPDPQVLARNEEGCMDNTPERKP